MITIQRRSGCWTIKVAADERLATLMPVDVEVPTPYSADAITDDVVKWVQNFLGVSKVEVRS